MRVSTIQFLVIVAAVAVVTILAGVIGNKIVDGFFDGLRNKEVRRKNAECPPERESLRDRFESQSK